MSVSGTVASVAMIDTLITHADGYRTAAAATSGVCLLATKATEYVGNPFLYVKFPAIAVGVLNALMLHRHYAPRD